MVRCSRCGKEVFSGEYLKIDNNPVCFKCPNEKIPIIKCPKCNKNMDFGRIGIKVPWWSVMMLWGDWASNPYWYDKDDIVHFSKNQNAYLCKKCKVMTVL